MSDNVVTIVSIVAPAIVSVIVAVGGFVLTHRSGEAQRDHESRLAYEERAWDRKTEALLKVIATTRSVYEIRPRHRIDHGDVYQHRMNEYLLRAFESRKELSEIAPVVEAFASEACSEALRSVIGILSPVSEEEEHATWRAVTSRHEKVRALDSQDFETAARYRQIERTSLDEARSVTDYPEDAITDRLEALLAAARKSVRGEDTTQEQMT